MAKLARDIDESASVVIGYDWPLMVWPSEAVLTGFQCAHDLQWHFTRLVTFVILKGVGRQKLDPETLQ